MFRNPRGSHELTNLFQKMTPMEKSEFERLTTPKHRFSISKQIEIANTILNTSPPPPQREILSQKYIEEEELLEDTQYTPPLPKKNIFKKIQSYFSSDEDKKKEESEDEGYWFSPSPKEEDIQYSSDDQRYWFSPSPKNLPPSSSPSRETVNNIENILQDRRTEMANNLYKDKVEELKDRHYYLKKKHEPFKYAFGPSQEYGSQYTSQEMRNWGAHHLGLVHYGLPHYEPRESQEYVSYNKDILEGRTKFGPKSLLFKSDFPWLDFTNKKKTGGKGGGGEPENAKGEVEEKPIKFGALKKAITNYNNPRMPTVVGGGEFENEFYGFGHLQNNIEPLISKRRSERSTEQRNYKKLNEGEIVFGQNKKIQDRWELSQFKKKERKKKKII